MNVDVDETGGVDIACHCSFDYFCKFRVRMLAISDLIIACFVSDISAFQMLHIFPLYFTRCPIRYVCRTPVSHHRALARVRPSNFNNWFWY